MRGSASLVTWSALELPLSSSGFKSATRLAASVMLLSNVIVRPVWLVTILPATSLWTMTNELAPALKSLPRVISTEPVVMSVETKVTEANDSEIPVDQSLRTLISSPTWAVLASNATCSVGLDTFVNWSAELMPESLAVVKLSVTAVVPLMLLSTVSAWLLLLVALLPARSNSLTRIVPAANAPSGNVKLVPLPVAQTLPLLVLYCQWSVSDASVTLTVPWLVMSSVYDVPVSDVRAKVAATGATVSTVMASCVAALLLLPAASVNLLALTSTVAPVVLVVAGVKLAV